MIIIGNFKIFNISGIYEIVTDDELGSSLVAHAHAQAHIIPTDVP
jgi:hypothetical protein